MATPSSVLAHGDRLHVARSDRQVTVNELTLDDGCVRDQLGAVSEQDVEPAERVLEVLVREVPERVGEERAELVALGRREVRGVNARGARYV